MFYYGRFSQLLTPLFPHTPRLSVVKHVVKNRFLNTLVTEDRKRFFIVFRSAADGCFVAPVCRIVPLLERLSKSFMQGQAAQNLHRYRQRIHSRICPLKIKLTLQKYYFGLNLVSPQKLLHSRNLSGILRESMFEIRESTCSYEQVLFTQPYPKKYCFISETPPSLSQNHS